MSSNANTAWPHGNALWSNCYPRPRRHSTHECRAPQPDRERGAVRGVLALPVSAVREEPAPLDVWWPVPRGILSRFVRRRLFGADGVPNRRLQATVWASVRFLHLQSRSVGKLDVAIPSWPANGEPSFQHVPALSVGGRLYQPWQEAVERTVLVADCRLDHLLHEPRSCDFFFPRAPYARTAPRVGASRRCPGRQREAVGGTVTLSAAPAGEGLFRLTVQVRNETPWPAGVEAERSEASLRALVSAHVVVTVQDGDFVSLFDPPDAWRDPAAACRNVGLWPVLVGDEGSRDTMLASPIILYDYPQVAEESPGDLFDATEIDEILTLRILTLTEDESVRSPPWTTAPARIERTESLTPEGCSNCTAPSARFDPCGGTAHD